MTELFVNGPVQNGDFSFADKPGRLVGFRLSGTLNALSTGLIAPHVWNIVTLSGDVAYDLSGPESDRYSYELQRVQQKYGDATVAEADLLGATIMTDTDSSVVSLGQSMVEEGLQSGRLKISKEKVNVCGGCGHMAGSAVSCKACGGSSIFTEDQMHLVAPREGGEPTLLDTETYGHVKAKYISDMGMHQPNPLILSRTRATGIDLSSFGLNKLVLDPRAGLHVAVLAAAKTVGADSAVMMITPDVATNIAAHGMIFRRSNQGNVKYGLHGRVPYDALPEPDKDGFSEEELVFRNWFLPLQSLVSRQPIAPEQLPALRKFFGKIARAEIDGITAKEKAALIAEQIVAGNLRWISDRNLVAHAARARRS